MSNQHEIDLTGEELDLFAEEVSNGDNFGPSVDATSNTVSTLVCETEFSTAFCIVGTHPSPQ
jgi:hypothetical protein